MYLASFRFSVGCWFLRFSGGVAFFASKDIRNIRIHYRFLTFFWVLASGLPTVASGPTSAKFYPHWLHAKQWICQSAWISNVLRFHVHCHENSTFQSRQLFTNHYRFWKHPESIPNSVSMHSGLRCSRRSGKQQSVVDEMAENCAKIKSTYVICSASDRKSFITALLAFRPSLSSAWLDLLAGRRANGVCRLSLSSWCRRRGGFPESCMYGNDCIGQIMCLHSALSIPSSDKEQEKSCSA